LDIEQAPGAQGFAAGGFDLVVAANVLHATRDVRASLSHAVSLLAPGGSLVLLEGTSARHWVDLTFGLTEGWWRFADRDLRPSHPLLPAAVWEGLLAECGLEVAVVPGGSGLLFDQALVVGRRGAGDGRWLVVGPGAAAIAPELRLEAGAVEDVGSLAAALCGGPVGGVVALTGAAADASTSCRAALSVIQALEASGFAGRLVLATQDAVAAAAGDRVTGLGGCAVWGLGAVAGLEHPEWDVRRVDLPADGEPASLGLALRSEILLPGGEEQVAWRGGQRLVARLGRRGWPGELRALRWRGTWLVTGGLGGLGLAVAGWLAGRGVSRVVLVGRRAASGGAAAAVAAIAGAEVMVADVRDRAGLASVVAACGPELRGVVHAAGVLDDGALGQLDWDRFAKVLDPKVEGARHLHDLTLDHALDGFVLFSSAASLLGNAGQANHAAANAWLDGLAHHRHALGLPALSVNWGAWGEIGAAANTIARMHQRGYLPISTASGLDALERALASGWPQVGLSPMEWEKVAVPGRPFLRDVQPARSSAPSSRRPPNVVQSPMRPEDIEDAVAGLVAAVLGRADAVDREMGLFSAGLDSLMSIELRNQMQRAFEIPLSATVAFDHPTIAALARHVRERLSPASLQTVPVNEMMSDAEAEALIDAELASIQARV
jgi:NAD(P)-dependent dehydrogenase (short-subunit alcohol dehydrogenase family)